MSDKKNPTHELSDAARVHLRALAEALPAGAAVSVPREWVLALVGEVSADAVEIDYTLDDVAAMFGRARTTIRGYCAAGLFPGAYLNQGHEWRIPRAAIRAYQERERRRGQSARGTSAAPSGERSVSLSDWREAS
jgi:hypothetical protein